MPVSRMVIEALMGRHRWRIDAFVRRDRRDEYVDAAELDVNPPGSADDLPAEDIFEPGRGRLGIGTAQVNMVPGDYRHRCFSPWLLMRRLIGRRYLAAEYRGRAILAAASPHGHPPRFPEPTRTAGACQYCCTWGGTIPGLRPLMKQAAEPRNRQSLLKAVRCNARAAFCCAAQQHCWFTNGR